MLSKPLEPLHDKDCVNGCPVRPSGVPYEAASCSLPELQKSNAIGVPNFPPEASTPSLSGTVRPSQHHQRYLSNLLFAVPGCTSAEQSISRYCNIEILILGSLAAFCPVRVPSKLGIDDDELACLLFLIFLISSFPSITATACDVDDIFFRNNSSKAYLSPYEDRFS